MMMGRNVGWLGWFDIGYYIYSLGGLGNGKITHQVEVIRIRTRTLGGVILLYGIDGGVFYPRGTAMVISREGVVP